MESEEDPWDKSNRRRLVHDANPRLQGDGKKRRGDNRSIFSPLNVCVVNKLRPHIIVQCGGAGEGGDGNHDLRIIFSV